MTLRELGRRMVERGAFDEIEDFGMLRKAEFDDFLARPETFTNTIRARRASTRSLPRSSPRSCSSESRTSLRLGHAATP